MENFWLGAARSLAGLVITTFIEGATISNLRIDDAAKQLVFNAFGRYIQNYRDRHGILRVLGMPKPIELETVYTGVQFLGQEELRRFISIENLEAAFRLAGRRFQPENYQKQDGLKIANDLQYLMVLGQPGAGKTTFLRRIGLEALKSQKGNYQHGCIPVLVELKRFNTGEIDIERAIVQELENCRFPDPIRSTERLLAKGKLLILLDGLDEVPTDHLNQAITQIQDFVDRYKQNRFIASCRTAAYHSQFRQFVDVVMADFDNSQIRQFITNWFQSAEDRQAGTAQRCWQLLQQPEYAATKELAQTPLLLTLLCLVFDESQAFPKNRALLYKEAIDVLLKKWAAEKRIQRDPIYTDLSVALEEMMLAEIAHEGFANDRLFFSKREVIRQITTFLEGNLNAPKHLDGEEVLQAIQIQQGILVERAKDVLSFSHLTVQEYLVAQHVADNSLTEQMVAESLTDKRWKEVFQLVAGSMRVSADSFLLEMEAKAQEYINTDRLKRLICWAEQATADSRSDFSPAAKRILAILFARIRALDNARAHTIESAVRLSLALVPSLNFTNTLVNPRELDLSCAFARAHEMAELDIFNAVNLPTLTSQLNTLQLARREPLLVRRPLTRELHEIWCNALHLDPNWTNLDREEINALSNCLYANELIVRCKEAAVRVMPKTWESIESRILTVRE